MCWLKSEVKPAVENQCCVSGIKGAGLVEKKSGPVEMSIDRTGGDYRHFDLKSDPSGEACKKACEDENRCRAWTYVRPGYLGPRRFALLSQGQDHQAAPQAVLHVRRGALAYRAKESRQPQT